MGIYSGGLIIGRIFASEIWGAYFREGLSWGELIIGILRYSNNIESHLLQTFVITLSFPHQEGLFAGWKKVRTIWLSATEMHILFAYQMHTYFAHHNLVDFTLCFVPAFGTACFCQP